MPKPIIFPEQNIEYASDQPPYLPLPAHVTDDNVVISCWQLSEAEIAQVAKTGKIWVYGWTFGRALQPQAIEVNDPFTEGGG